MTQHNEISDWTLERFCLGELPEAERQNIQQAVDQDSALRARLADLDRSDEDIRRAYPADLRRLLRNHAGAGGPVDSRALTAVRGGSACGVPTCALPADATSLRTARQGNHLTAINGLFTHDQESH